jgi:hypothetical protein
MSKKHDTASALAGILQAKRPAVPASSSAVPAAEPPEPAAPRPPSPALPAPSPVVTTAKAETAAEKRRGGKSSDPTYSQFSVYLRKATHKRVKRRLDDLETGQDVSELVQNLLEQWLASSI